ncbi:CvpA family protein [Companilactobacillus mishanensis]|uniref:CvpA family protein n=1 Tax=Companilactobacillus mishanensis TaxID=2486008 RepID=A0A5P0ZIG5_9LACO|nr:CvpA family protein [Companilactobacillus mishanensis]MQS44782.1 CvpA family protein [Companilactobacillus mishanensis]MQS52896.1 CvpA family protein [Companilactobacillus mishanensis]MQS89297.1 CvpA family protein [Companilactobacillus mishanensis]
MLSLLIILLLVYGFYVGARRGLAMQAFYTIGYSLFFGLALVSFRFLGPKFEMIVPYPSASLGSEFAFFSTKVGMELDDAFYRAFAFIFVCFVGWIIIRFAGLYFKRLTYVPMYNDVNLLSGGILGLLVTYVTIFMVLLMLAMIPVSGIQHALSHSFVASAIIEGSPLLTKGLTSLWIASV